MEEKKERRVFSPEQKFEILKDIERCLICNLLKLLLACPKHAQDKSGRVETS